MPIKSEKFGEVCGQSVERFTLNSADSITVKIITYGGRITEIYTPDRSGTAGNITLGFDSLAPYLVDKAYLGTLVGPVANRIGNATFRLNGRQYPLTANDGAHTLHGGANGFDKAVWQAVPMGEQSLELRFTSRDGNDGFPGALACVVRYTLNGKKLVIDYTATTDKPTPVNLTNHAYFNLAGPGSGDVLGHEMTIAAGSYTPVNAKLIPTGELKNVQNTPMDFRQATTIGARIAQLGVGHGLGYDHNYVLDSRGDAYRMAVSVCEPLSGRVINVHTTEPGMQFYSGNFLDGSIVGNGGTYRRHGAFCLEAQQFPDAINQPNFPTPLLQPGETYRQTTTYEFTTDAG